MRLPALLARTAVSALALLTLTGCVRLEMTATIAPDDTITGTLVQAFDLEALRSLAGEMEAGAADNQPADDLGDEWLLDDQASAEVTDAGTPMTAKFHLAADPEPLPQASDDEMIGEILAEMEDRAAYLNDTLPAQAVAAVFETKNEVGVQVRFEALPLTGFDELLDAFNEDPEADTPDASAQVTGSIDRVDDTYLVDLAMAGDDNLGMIRAMVPDSTITLTFPGEIIDTNGEMSADKKTATWEFKIGEDATFTATAKTAPALPLVAILTGLALLILAAGVAAGWVMARRKRGSSGAEAALVPSLAHLDRPVDQPASPVHPIEPITPPPAPTGPAGLVPGPWRQPGQPIPPMPPAPPVRPPAPPDSPGW